MEVSPINGWFIRENPPINGWFGVTPILGNPDVLLFEFFTLDKADIDIFLLAEMWIFVLREYVLFFGELRISKFKVTAYDKVTKLLYK